MFILKKLIILQTELALWPRFDELWWEGGG
jgi:hypothetical protein